MDSRFYEIVGNKPELINIFPKWMLSEARESELSNTEGLAIAEIAGRDSIAAVLEATRKREFKAILPTIAYTGTEFGDWTIPFHKTELLKTELVQRGIKVFDPILLGAPRLWWRLCGRYVPYLFKEFGFYSPCVGCHLYLHTIRIPLAQKVGCTVVIGGERESHEGKTKINQIGVALDAYISLAKIFGIELFLPIRNIAMNRDIEKIIKQPWEEGEEQLGCVLSKNYQDKDGNVFYEESGIEKFFKQFAIIEAENTLKSYLNNS
jgi:hypothetical protein